MHEPDQYHKARGFEVSQSLWRCGCIYATAGTGSYNVLTTAVTCDLCIVICSGRTALLFHYAYTHAAAHKHVLFVTRRQEVEFDPPLLPAGISSDDIAFQRIHMRQVHWLLVCDHCIE